MTTVGWCTKGLASPTCSGEVRQRFLQPFQQSHMARRRPRRDSRSQSSRASSCCCARVRDLPSLTTVPAAVASEMRKSCSSRVNHEDHAKLCADQAGSHAVHVDGRLRRPTDEGTVWLTDNQRGRLSKIRARHATRLRETQPVVADASAANEVVLIEFCSFSFAYAADIPALYTQVIPCATVFEFVYML